MNSLVSQTWKYTWRGMRNAFFVFLEVSVVLFLAFATIFAYVYYHSPEAGALVTRAQPQTSIIYDKTGEHILYKIHGEENRKVISHEEIPDNIRIATIAAEDDGFYHHIGIDPLGIIRAARENIASNEKAQGGSTITQQLVRNAFLTREKTYDRKFKEVVMSIKLEQTYEKDEILDFYLNEVPYGSNAYGIESAAQIYFGKDAGDLTLDEAALIASLPKATTYYSPYGTHTDLLEARQKFILARVAELGLADEQEVTKALETDTLAKIIPFVEEIDAPHFVFYVREYLEKEYGRDAVEQGGFQVYTTLDYDMQKRAEEILRDKKDHLKKYGASNASLVALDPRTGGVLAMVGSVDYFDQAIDGEVNVSLRERQPGSSFKPVAYAAAFEKGFQPETMLFDVRTNFGRDGSGKAYIPQNYDGSYHGLVSMRKALAGSLNIPAVKTLYLAGIDDTIDLAERLGITTFKDRNRYGLALVLGGGEVTLLEETGAFGVFANDGIRHAPNPIQKIIGEDGVFYERADEVGERALDHEVARRINSILSDNKARAYVFGTNSPLTVPDRTVAAKTGTTQDYHDAWTVGYTPSLAVGIWAGNNDNTAMRAGSAGTYVAAPIWNAFMKQELEMREDESFMDYIPYKTNKPFIVGNASGASAYYDKKTGEQISEEKLRKTSKKKLEKRYDLQQHSILYYVDKDDPLASQEPNFRDPMLPLWDKSLHEPIEDLDKTENPFEAYE